VVIVQIRDGKTSYALYADRRGNGDVVIAGHDLTRWQADGYAGDEYEYFYTVRAPAVPRLCAELGVEPAGVLDGIRALLAPHGITASTAWRAWLQAHDVAYEFAVR
jgi:hypothetical protein